MDESFKVLGIAATDCEGNKRSLRDVMNDIAKLYGVQPEPEPLLTIELENETSVPKVFYKGEEITGRIHISFAWDTKDTYSQGGLSYAIENSGKDNIVNRIERRTKDHR